MDSISESIVRDRSLAPEGRLKMDWARQHMPVLERIRREFLEEQPLAGQRVAISLHLEAKTARLAEVLRDAGAEVTITGSNPLSTKDDVAAARSEEHTSERQSRFELV